MGKKLVIVESPAKARTINKFLGKDFVVKASMGHVRDLPERKFGVDIDNDFKPQYETIKKRGKTIDELKKAAKSAEAVYLAPDPDREGEAIAWHLLDLLQKQMDGDRFFRVVYNEITKSAIHRAFDQAGRIDMNKVDAQQARRVLDRIVGYKISPLLWRRVRGGSSAGRVQSVALRLLCEREEDIRKFVPEDYWVFGAKVRKKVDPMDPFELRLAKIMGENPDIRNEDRAGEILSDLERRELIVSAINDREIKRRTRPSFITSTLQQTASNALGYSPSRTMSIAQRLYEGVDFGDGPVGLITYMRTDSPAIAKDAQDACREFIGRTYGDEYIPEKPNFFKSRGGAQEAHEAIRPTDVNRTPDEMASVLKPEELKLYRLIWQRFVASQMTPARIKQRTVEVQAVLPGSEFVKPDAGTPEYLFRVTASEIIFPGFMKATGEDKKKKKESESGDKNSESDDTEAESLPPLDVGEGLDLLEWLSEKKQTKPPPRYTEASLVRTLEENGVGRPSTYAQILQTLYARKYMEREKQSLKPTEPGERVNEFLTTNLNELFDVQFTAEMEKQLDDIEEGRIEWTKMMRDFHDRFQQWLEKAKGPEADQGAAAGLIEYIGQIKEWAPPEKRGKRTYSDEKFVESVRKQLGGDKKISQRQVIALLKMAMKYKVQLPDLEKKAEELGFSTELKEASKDSEPPREETKRKLEILKGINFDEPRKVGKRTYDDKEFCESLRRQVESGKRLSINQIRYLDRIMQKYSDQIEGFDMLVAELGIEKEESADNETVEALLNALRQVKEWNPPVKRGRRDWDDRKFFESLDDQYNGKKTLSPKQLQSLKKMASRYASQIPDFDELSERLDIPKPREKKASGKTDK